MCIWVKSKKGRVRGSLGSERGSATLSLALLALAASFSVGPASAQIYKVTDDEQGVVFTDRPENIDGNAKQSVEKVELPQTNTAAPIQPLPRSATRGTNRAAGEEEDAVTPTVSITSPANETTIAMGPGNFTVSASAKPPLNRDEELILIIDGQPVGSAQKSTSWFIEGALRGPHDLVVQRVNGRGGNVAISEPVRVYVLRPSIIRR